MTFLQPLMLWSLAALVPLAAFYFLKVRPRRKPTTALFLWEKIWQQRRASRLFRNLRDFWSLLLMLLACSAVCLALARPEWNDRRQDMLILLDASASMNARQGGTTRMDLAKKTAAEIVEGLNGTQRAAVATVARNLTYRSHLTDNPRELLDAVESIKATNQELCLDALPDREDQRNRFLRDHRVLLISDGCFDAKKLPKHVELIKVGDPLENAGIAAADMDFLPTGRDQLGCYVQVASSFAKPREADLVVARLNEDGKEQVARVIPLEITPGLNRPETVTLEDAQPGKWIARLAIDDAMATDNTAYLAVERPAPIRVAVKSDDRFFLENSVLAFSRGAGLLTLVKEKPDVVLASGVVPEGENLLLFQPSGPSCWWNDLGEEIEAGVPRVLIENHPALRHLDAASIHFVGARRLTPPKSAQVLVADDDGLPLIYKAWAGKRTAIVVNMNPASSEFYFSAWFPVLVHSVSRHLAGQEDSLAATYRPGEKAPIPGASDATVSIWTIAPEQKTEVRGKWLTLDDRLGHSELSNPSGRRYLGNSLLSASETMLDEKGAASNAAAISRGRSPGQWLTMLAIAVLTFESLLYHRRKVG